jgi:hypothetical protein
MDKLKTITAHGAASTAMTWWSNAQARPVAFTLKLSQGWFGRFTGTVTDDAATGMPGIGPLRVTFFPTNRIHQADPVCYVCLHRTVET